MATVNFYLDSPDRKSECPIFLVYQSKGKKFKYFTKEKIEPKAWDDRKQRVKRNYSGDEQINSFLQNLKAVINKIERDARYNFSDLSVSYVQEKFFDQIGYNVSGSDFYSIFEKYLKSSSITKTTGTVRKIKTTLSRLKEFELTRKYQIDFGTITLDFYDKFLDFLINDLSLLNNSVGKHIKTLKAFMNYASENGYNKNSNDYRKFKALREEVEIIYLTESELFRIYNVELDSETLKSVRDNFCFSCFTGLRFSDLKKIKKSNIQQDFITIRTEKTRDYLKVPLNDFSKEILKEYGGQLPNSISNQKSNMYLKHIGELAGIDDSITISQYSGSRKIERILPKFQFISTHTGRRTFITLSLEKGIRAEVVMEMTGHKDYSTFKKYIKITDNVKLFEMQKYWNNNAKLSVI
ncbi:MAG: site-specific integrase [Bacteroidetes bacterium]|nr:site-specific integrase [Bacteroidota bacterium]